MDFARLDGELKYNDAEDHHLYIEYDINGVVKKVRLQRIIKNNLVIKNVRISIE